MKISKTCTNCNNEFLGHAHQRFCSRPCCSKWHKFKWSKDRQAAVDAAKKPKNCKNCGKSFMWKGSGQRHCSTECQISWATNQNNARRKLLYNQGRLPIALQGANSELLVCTDLLQRGWYVYKSVSHQAPFDLVGYKDGILIKIEVKTGRRYSEGYVNHTRASNSLFDILAVYSANTQEILYEPALPT